MSLQAELDNLHRHHDATESLGYLADELADLARSLRHVGFLILSENLAKISIEIRRNTKDARDAFTFEVNGRHQDTVQATANMIGACMAVDKAKERP